MHSDATLKFLIIEDIPDVATRLEHEMKKYTEWKYVGNAKSVREAKWLIEQEQPQLLFCDWDLIGGSGFEVLQYVQTLSNYQPFVVFNTGFQSDHPEIAEELINTYRPDVFINKPYWKKLQEQIPAIVVAAQQKSASINEPPSNCWIQNTEGKQLKINAPDIICIIQSPAHPRQKVIHTTLHKSGIHCYLTWPEVIALLKQNQIHHFVVNKRQAIVCKQHIVGTDRQYVHLHGLPFKIEVVKDLQKDFLQWLR
jgi:two-component system, LytTR family, response regulator